MANIAIVYFSGTYHTLQITTFIKNKLLNLHHNVDVFSLNNNLKINIDNYDYLFLGYPIHAFNMPKGYLKSIKKLKINNKKCLIYKVSGEPFIYNNASSFALYRHLKRNNNTFLGEYHFLMPYNILFRTKENFIRYELEYDLKYMDYMIASIDNKQKYHPSLFSKIITLVFKIQRLGCKLNSHFYKVDKEKCIKCRECYLNCPTQNITYNKEKHRLVFSNKCVMCMRCSFMCPTDAIKIGLLNKKKVNHPYNIYEILKQDNNYDFSQEKKKFYLKFRPYFNMIDHLDNSKDD